MYPYTDFVSWLVSYCEIIIFWCFNFCLFFLDTWFRNLPIFCRLVLCLVFLWIPSWFINLYVNKIIHITIHTHYKLILPGHILRWASRPMGLMFESSMHTFIFHEKKSVNLNVSLFIVKQQIKNVLQIFGHLVDMVTWGIIFNALVCEIHSHLLFHTSSYDN